VTFFRIVNPAILREKKSVNIVQPGNWRVVFVKKKHRSARRIKGIFLPAVQTLCWRDSRVARGFMSYHQDKARTWSDPGNSPIFCFSSSISKKDSV
jgi:hypothetical protein